MTLLSRPIPGLFGGVSQQIPAMRHPTHGDLQENALATLVDGLYKRPGTKVITNNTGLTWATGAALSGNAFAHVIDRPGKGLWAALLNGSGLQVLNMLTGALEPVAFPDGTAYLTAANPQGQFRCITVAESTFIVNMGVTVGSLPSDGLAWPETDNLVYVRSGPIGQTFTIKLPGYGEASYTSGTSGVNVGVVVGGLISALNAMTGVTAAQDASTTGLILISTLLPTLAAVKDTFGNSTMTSLRLGVNKFSDLPPRAPAGYRVTINGDIATEAYLVQWNGLRWEEARAYGISPGLVPATMPLMLQSTGAGTWKCTRPAWADRLVGSDTTNPLPSFVGKPLREIFFYRNRLGFLSGDSLAMSRSGGYYNFFASSTVSTLDTDPIDIGSAVASVDTLDYAVPFNENMTIWASSRQQFSLVGGDTLTPATARLVPTTAFDADNRARPKPMGNKVVYAFTAQGAAQLGLYRASRDTVSTTVESLTEHVPTYIPVAPKALETTEAFKAVVLLPAGLSNTLYFFKYEDDGEKLSQRAWQKFTFEVSGIVKAHWSGSRLYLFMHYVGWGGEDRTVLEVIDFNPTALDTGAPHVLHLDRRSPVISQTTTGTETTLVFDGRLVGPLCVLASGDANTLEYVIKATEFSSSTTAITVIGQPAGSVQVGVKYGMKYRFTEVYAKDRDGVPIMSAKLKLLKMQVRHVNTGPFTATVDIRNSGTYTYPFASEGVGLLGQLLGTTPDLVSGTFSIPVQCPAKDAVITLDTSAWQPARFPYAEWKGNLVMAAKR